MSRAVREAALGFTRTGGMVILSVGVIAVSYLVLVIFMLLQSNMSQALETLRSRAELVVYLKDVPSANERQKIIDKLTKRSWITDAKYVSKKQAMNTLKNTLKNDELLLNALQDNPLPPSFRLRMLVNEGIEDSVKVLEQELPAIVPQFEELRYSLELLRPLERAVGAFRYATLFLGLIIGLSIIFIISNTIKLTLHARQQEIEIMALVGATRGFIRKPYVIEGMFQGLFGTIIALGIAYLIYMVSHRYLPQLHFLRLEEIGMVILIGWVLGGLGSMLSLGRFLRY